MIRLYAQYEPYALLIRAGRTFASMAAARKAANALANNVVQLEIRDDALPRSKSLLAIYSEGKEIAAI